MMFLIVEPSPLPILIPLGPKYNNNNNNNNNNNDRLERSRAPRIENTVTHNAVNRTLSLLKPCVVSAFVKLRNLSGQDDCRTAGLY